MNEQQVRALIQDELGRMTKTQNHTFQRHLVLLNGTDIILGGVTGTRIGTQSIEKLGFYGATPVVRPSAVTTPSGGGTVDSQARTAINDTLTRLQALGLFS